MTEEPIKKCEYCRQPMTVVYPMKIIYRMNKRVMESTYDFCSKEHGGFYQMGCEG